MTRNYRPTRRASIGAIIAVLLVSLIPGVALAGSVTNLSNTDGESEGPAVAASGKHVHAVWADDNDDHNWELVYAHSSNRGKTWDSRQLTSLAAGSVYKPAIASYGSYVHVTFTVIADHPGTGIWYTRSTNYGKTWSSPRLVADGLDYHVQSDIAVDGPNVHITWNSGAWESDIYTVRSRNSGKTWGPIRNLTNNTSTETGPRVEVIGTGADAVVVVVWEGDDDDIRYRRSTNNGKTWSKSKRIAKTHGQSYAPDIAASGGRVYVAWVDQTLTPGVGEIYFKLSDDGGVTWRGWKRLSSTVGPSYPPKIGAGGSMVDVAWAEGGATTEVFISRSSDSGNSWTDMKRITVKPFDSHHPDLATAGGRAHVVWEDEIHGSYHTEAYYRNLTS